MRPGSPRLTWRSTLAWLALCLLSLGAAANPVSTENVTARLIAERTHATPGTDVALLLVLDIRPHWHTYWRNPGDSGEPPRIDWTLPDGVEAGALDFAAPELIRVGPLANFGYSNRALHPVSLRIPADWPAGRPIPVVAEAHWLVCEEHCIPESARLELALPVDRGPGPIDAENAALFESARAGLPAGSIAGAEIGPKDGAVRLSVPWVDAEGAARPAPRSVRFFPGAWGLVEHAAEQPWHITATGPTARLEIDLAPGDASDAAPPGGLLVVTDSAGERMSYALDPVRTSWPPGEAKDQGAGLGLVGALGLAFLGGLILNLMPCVFPVLAIKALSLAGQGGLDARERAWHGLAYTAGVLVFFGLLAAILLGLRASGASVGWGFQLQHPPFVALMAGLFLVLGLSLSGALTLGAGLMGLGGRAAGGGEGAFAAFLTGALAALVAAPCTAPFMGAALGYAVTLPGPLAMLIMLTLGLGLAAPFLLLSLWPGLARRLPRPGAWMETLKQLLAFPMFAASAWLTWVVAVQAGADGLALLLTGMLVLAFGLWARERTRLLQRPWDRAGLVLSVVCLAGALWLGLLVGEASRSAGPVAGVSSGQEGLSHEPYSPGRLDAALADGRAVFVNMTAAWCITCLVNERVALDDPAVAAGFAEADLLYLKGDWTNRDPAITDYLAGFGRNGVPIYVLYPPGGEPRVLPQILTPGIVTAALADAGLMPRVSSTLNQPGANP